MALDVFSDLSEAPSTDAEVIVRDRRTVLSRPRGPPRRVRVALLAPLFDAQGALRGPARARRAGSRVVVAVAIRSSDLSKAYAPLPEEICGVHQDAAAEAWRTARRELVPIDLDEYDGDVVAEREVVVPVLRRVPRPGHRGRGGAELRRRRRRPRRPLRRRLRARSQTRVSCASSPGRGSATRWGWTGGAASTSFLD